ncbi:DUF255 domain-containing protein [Desulfurispira natronophila]|nr:DUF255 domain-containing protein [Desulfurispira natronophila]
MIHWKSWSREAFEQADERLQLILLSLVSEMNQRARDTQFSSDDQEEYTFEELERNFAAVEVVVEQRPDLEQLLSPGHYPASLILSPQGRVLRMVEPKEENLFEALFQARRDAINQGTGAGSPMCMPAYPQSIDTVYTAENVKHVAANLLSSVAAEVDQAHQPRNTPVTAPLTFNAPMLLFCTQAAHVLGDEFASSLAAEYMEQMATLLWDPEQGGFFMHTQGEGFAPVKRLQDQLMALEAMVEMASQDEASSRTAVEALLHAIEGNFSKENGLYSLYSTTPNIYSEPNFHLLRILIQAHGKALLPSGLEDNLEPLAQNLAALVHGQDGAVSPWLGNENAPALLGTQAAAARALLSYASYSGKSEFGEAGLTAMGYVFQHLLSASGGATTVIDDTPWLPRLRPLDTNMSLVQACCQAWQFTGASMYEEYARHTLATFRDNHKDFGYQQYTYGSGLLALATSSQLL